MAAVSTMLLRSLRLIGEKARGDTLSSAEQTECLAEFNTFLDATANERLLAYHITEDVTTFAASTVSLTIGTNGAFAVPRPVRLVDPCFVRDASGYDTSLQIIGTVEYGRIVDKNAGYTVPTQIFYDSGFSATSTGTLYLYPASSGGLELHINSWRQLGSVSTLTHNVSLPPGYQLFLETNFAIHLAAGQTPVSAELAKMARDSKAAVKGVNLPDVVMQMDVGVVAGRRSNIFTGP